MIIDDILDRKEGYGYDPMQFYCDVREYASVFDSDTMRTIAEEIQGGVEQRVKFALCAYILDYGYNPEICDFVNSVNWL